MKAIRAIELLDYLAALCIKEGGPDYGEVSEFIELIKPKIGGCSLCNSTGELISRSTNFGGGYKVLRGKDGNYFYSYPCPVCKGKGNLVEDNCASCNTRYVVDVFNRIDIDGKFQRWCNSCWASYENRHGIIRPPAVIQKREEPKIVEPPKQKPKIELYMNREKKGK